MSLKSKYKLSSIASDLFLSILAMVFLNGIIQLLVYPYFNYAMGADRFGTVLYLLSIVAIMGSTFGSSANYSRMITSTKRESTNGDYNIFLIIVSVLCLVVSYLSLFILKSFSVNQYILLSILMILSVFRYYGDVEFRLSLNYIGYFFYYFVIFWGYIIGILTYFLSKSWDLVMILGELAAILFVTYKGKIFKKPFLQRSSMFKENVKSMITLSAADLISALILNADRILIMLIIGGAQVTLFYTASIVGKIIALLTVPLNGVLIGYLSRYKGILTTKKFLYITLGTLVVGLAGTLVCTGISFIFVRIEYKSIYEQAKPYFLVANASQIFYFISNTLMVVLLRFAEEKYQLIINVIYAVLFAIIVIPMTIKWKLWGIAIALLIINLLKYLMICAMGIYFSKNAGGIEDGRTV